MKIPMALNLGLRRPLWAGLCWTVCATGLGAQELAANAPTEECQITVTASPLEYRQFDDVEVLGVAITDPQAKQAQPTQVICWRDVQRSGAQRLPELLAQLPALLPGHALDWGSALHGTAIRGKSAGTLVLVNGHRLPASVDSPWVLGGERLDLRVLPVSAVERIEVHTVGASSAWGSDATAGIVNIITRQTRGLSVRAEASAATPGEGRGQSLALSWGQGSLRTDLYRLQAHLAWAQPDLGVSGLPTHALSTVQARTLGQWFVEGELALGPRWTGFAHLLGVHESPQAGLVQARASAAGTQAQWLDSFNGLSPWPLVQQEGQRQQQWRLGLKGPWQDWDVLASASDGRVRHQTQSRPLLAPPDTPWDAAAQQRLDALLGLPALAAQHSETQLSTLQLLASREWGGAPWGPATWRWGWDWRQEALRAGADSVPAEPLRGQRQQWALHSEVKTPLADQHELTASLRHDQYSDMGQAQTGQLGWKWRPQKEWLFRAWAGTGFRAPGLAQLQASGWQEWLAWDAVERRAFSVRRQGNAHLQAERSTHWSWGVRHEPHPRWTWGADLWQAQVRQAIGYQGLSRLMASQGLQSGAQGGYLDSVVSNLGVSEQRGLDYDMAWREATPLGVWRMSLQGTVYLKSSLQEAGTGRRVSDLAYFSGATDTITPRHVGVLGTSLERGPGLLMSHWRYRSGHAEDTDAGTRRVPAAWRWDLGGQWALNRQLTLSVWLKNATDRRPVQPLWRTPALQSTALQPLEDLGRVLHMRGEYRF